MGAKSLAHNTDDGRANSKVHYEPYTVWDRFKHLLVLIKEVHSEFHGLTTWEVG